MSGSSASLSRTPNSLYRLAGGASVLLAAFLLAGASGHFTAVWPLVAGADDPFDQRSLLLLLPGGILMATGLANIALCQGLWQGRRWALNVSLAFNAVALVYLGHLFSRGVPEHPIGVFFSMVAAFLLLLGAIRAGLAWPAPGDRSA